MSFSFYKIEDLISFSIFNTVIIPSNFSFLPFVSSHKYCLNKRVGVGRESSITWRFAPVCILGFHHNMICII